MASLSRDGAGWRIRFTCPSTRKRRTIRTGKCSRKHAATTLSAIEQLIQAKTLGVALEQRTAAWLASIDGKILDRLVKAGLATAKPTIDLDTFVSSYIDGRHDVKDESKTVWRQAEASLYEFFGKDRLVHTITTGEAEDFKQWLLQQGKAMYTVRKRLQGTRMFFNAMVDRGLIPRSPFDSVKGVQAVVDESRNVYVPREHVLAVMEKAPDREWAAMIALSRFAGLRLPSEVLSLKWEHIDWERNRITIISPKTARYANGGQRMIPLFPALFQPLLDAAEVAPDGAVYVVTRHRSQADAKNGSWKCSNLRTRFNKLVKRAGLSPWPKPFHGMRASCETDLLEKHPLQAVARWMGHSPKVAVANYLRVRDEHYDQATGGDGRSLAHCSPQGLPNEETPEQPRTDEGGSTAEINKGG
jgi:integrase